jgi:hypothetical protein
VAKTKRPRTHRAGVLDFFAGSALMPIQSKRKSSTEYWRAVVRLVLSPSFGDAMLRSERASKSFVRSI